MMNGLNPSQIAELKSLYEMIGKMLVAAGVSLAPTEPVPAGMIAVRPDGVNAKPGLVRYYPIPNPGEPGWTYYSRVSMMVNPATGKMFANNAITGAVSRFPWGPTPERDVDRINNMADWETAEQYARRKRLEAGYTFVQQHADRVAAAAAPIAAPTPMPGPIEVPIG